MTLPTPSSVPRRSSPTDLAVVYLNHGRWLADCRCGAGMLAGKLTAECAECGAVSRAVWPDPDTVHRVEELTAGRPLEAQNYDPRRGESLGFLRRENILMGVA